MPDKDKIKDRTGRAGGGTAFPGPGGRTWPTAAWAISLPVLHFTLMESYFSDPLLYMYGMPFMVSAAMFLLAELMLAAVMGSIRASVTVFGMAAMLMGLANRYVYLFRGAPVQVTDLKSAGTALTVAAGYDFAPDARIVIVTALFAIVLAMPFICRKAYAAASGLFARLCRMRRGNMQLAVAAACLAGIAALGTLAAWDYGRRCDNTTEWYYEGGIMPIYPVGTRQSVGTVYDWIGMASTSSVRKPAGYAGWEGSDGYDLSGAPDAGDLPDVIVVMDEAFSDPAAYASVPADRDWMPFVRSLDGKENSRLGELDVSILGGNTANTEFEFLTGCSLGCFPRNCIPYQNLMDSDCASLARYMSALGYETWALHPYSHDNWSRDTAYAYMGFDHQVFMDRPDGEIAFPRLPDGELLSDEGCYGTVSDILALDGKPKFIFLVTIYNHGGYMRDVPGLERDIEIDWDSVPADLTDTEKLCAETYLSMLAKSDRELAAFTGELSARSRESLVLFFGDHQPDMTARRVLSRMSGQDPDAVVPDAYRVPYAIWSTSPLPEGFEPGRRCAAWAGGDIFTCLGLPVPDFYGFVQDMSARVPSMTLIDMRDDGSDEAAGAIAEYRRMAYWRILDWHG